MTTSAKTPSTDYVQLADASNRQLAAAALCYIMEGSSYEEDFPAGTDPTRLRHTAGQPPRAWDFDPASWMPGVTPEVNYSRAKGYLDYLLNRVDAPDPVGTPVTLTRK